MKGNRRGRSNDPRALVDAIVYGRLAARSRDAAHVVVASEDAERRQKIAAALNCDGHRVSEARAPLELYQCIGVAGTAPAAPPVTAVVLDLTGRDWATPALLDVVSTERGELPVVALVGDSSEEAARRCQAAAVLRLPLDEASLRAELLALVEPVPSCRGAA